MTLQEQVRVLSERHVWIATAAELNRWAADVLRLCGEDGLPGTLRIRPCDPPPGCLRLDVDGREAWHLQGGEAVAWSGRRWDVVARPGPRPLPEWLAGVGDGCSADLAAHADPALGLDAPEDPNLAVLGEGHLRGEDAVDIERKIESRRRRREERGGRSQRGTSRR